VARGRGVGGDLAGVSLSSLDEQGKLVWSRAFLDGASSQRKGGGEIGLTKVGKGTKRKLVVDGNGIPLALVISRASRAAVRLAQETLDRVRVPRKSGRPGKRPERLVADKAYDPDEFRLWLRRKGVIPSPQEVGGGVQGALVRGADVCLGGELPAARGSL